MNVTYPLDMAAADYLRCVIANYPFQAQFVNVEGRAVAIHEHHRRRKIKAATRQDSKKKTEKYDKEVFSGLEESPINARHT